MLDDRRRFLPSEDGIMLFCLVFEHTYEGLNFQGPCDSLDVAIDHAQAIHCSVVAEVHELPIRNTFDEGEPKLSGENVAWTFFGQSGAI